MTTHLKERQPHGLRSSCHSPIGSHWIHYHRLWASAAVLSCCIIHLVEFLRQHQELVMQAAEVISAARNMQYLLIHNTDFGSSP